MIEALIGVAPDELDDIGEEFSKRGLTNISKHKAANMPIQWQAWTADKERFITFDADTESTQIRMNSTELVPSADDARRELEAWNHQLTIDYIKYFIISSYQHNWF